MGFEDGLFPKEMVERLKSKGIELPTELALCSFEGLKKLGLDDEEAEEIIKKAEEIMMSTCRGIRVVERGRQRWTIGTGSSSLDRILGGGIRSGLLTDFFGESGTGKTQLAFQLCVNVVQKGGNALFVDTVGTFRPERIVEICEARGLRGEQVLRSIFVSNLRGIKEQLELPKKLDELSSAKNIRLVAIDTLTENFLQTYGEEELIKRQSLLGRHLHELSILALRRNMAMVVTNTVRVIGDEDGELVEVGGNILAQGVHVRVHLMRKDKRRVARLLRAPFEPLEACYRISKEGVLDEEEDRW